jgi:hypothetical protein
VFVLQQEFLHRSQYFLHCSLDFCAAEYIFVGVELSADPLFDASLNEKARKNRASAKDTYYEQHEPDHHLNSAPQPRRLL